MYAVDPIGEIKRTFTKPIRNFLANAKELLEKVKPIPGEMLHIALADQQTANNSRWRDQQYYQKASRTEKWDAKFQLFSLKEMLRLGDLPAFRKRLGDFGWQKPEDLALLIGRSRGQILSTPALKKGEVWDWYMHYYQLAREHQTLAQWNELIRYLERHIKPLSK